MKDEQTKEFFDRFTPHYKPQRILFALQFIRAHSNPETRLIDIGCGDGSTLLLIQQNTPISFLTGMDISQQYLETVRERVKCQTLLGSILDTDLIAEQTGRYDICILSSVLHHLIARNRKESYRAAQKAMAGAIRLLTTGGHLVIYEPTFSPVFMMDMVFHLKKIFSRFSDNRIELFRKWINIGLPVVSFYTLGQILKMIDSSQEVTLLEKHHVRTKRKGFLIKRMDVGLILGKNNDVSVL